MASRQKYYAYVGRSRGPHDNDVIAVFICPVEVFDQTGHGYDQHLGCLPGLKGWLSEVSESLFFLNSTHKRMTVEQVVDRLTKLGYITANEKYNSFCQHSDPFV